MEGALKRFRIIANVVGVLLVLLALGMILKYLPPHWAAMAGTVAPIHGIFYMVYVVLGYDVWRRTGWPLIKLVDIVTAGFIPFRTFFVERRIVRQARETVAAADQAAVQTV